MVSEHDLDLGDGRTLHVYDTGPAAGGDGPVVLWHHGTPNVGSPPAPLFAVSERLGIRWVSYDRPAYGGSTPSPGRDLASAAGYASRVADELGIGRFAVMGHSGGGSHALACGALLPDRVRAVVGVSGPAPYGADGLDWFAGMSVSGQASLRAAVAGRAAKERHEAAAAYDPEMFTPADHDALGGDWSWFGSVVGPAVEG
ncbi:alpha/beta fold hydrolase, partial [Nonomuraea deserti]